ncbi:GntR family transcriptional regulator [Streptomyces zhihengii]
MTSHGPASRDGQFRYVQLADVLRKEINQGTRLPGQRIPTQEVLAAQYHVSRSTVIQAITLLREEGLVRVRQGSGTFVRELGDTAPATASEPADGGDESWAVVSEDVPLVRLKPYLEEAFEATEVTLDVFSMTTESLATQVSHQKDRILDGVIRPPRGITARLILPDTASGHLAIPRPVDGSDDPRVRNRMHGILTAHATILRESLYELRNRKLVPEVSVEVRLVPFSPQIKLYILNRRLALQGFYPPDLGNVTVVPGGEEVTILDAYGTGATLFPFRAAGDSTPDQVGIVRQMQKFFENTWTHQATRADI